MAQDVYLDETDGLSQMTIVIAILPGRAEAWRRFWQELQGPRATEFTTWRHRLGLIIRQLRLIEAMGGAIVLGQIEFSRKGAVIAPAIDKSNSFEVWLNHQVVALHGVDLGDLAQAATRLSGNKEMSL